MAFKTAHCTVYCMAHKGLNSPKRFTNLGVTGSSSPQNEKLLSYRKQKSCLGYNLNFAFLPHFTLRQFQLTSEKSTCLCSDFTEMLEQMFLKKLNTTTEGSRLMLLLGPGKNSHQPKIALAKFQFYVRSNKINSL